MAMRTLSACCLGLFLATAASAQEAAPNLADPTPAKGWIVTLGGSLQLGPKYDGSSSAGLSFMPSLSWRRVGEKPGFSAPDDSLDYALYETDRFSVGVAGAFRSGRYSG
ncbi:MipA/OmpV family protein, partial [Bosea spartocytisi]|nr:MipA/OmpV family protein [Bosea spartocytisi]